MPQLDLLSYFPQFFWFCVFFVFFYVSLVEKYLPKLNRILAVRQFYQRSVQENSVNSEVSLLSEGTEEIFKKSVEESKNLMVSHFSKTTNLLNIQKDVLNKHSHQSFEKYATKKIVLNQRVKETLGQLERVLPLSVQSSQKLPQKKNTHFFNASCVQKLMKKNS